MVDIIDKVPCMRGQWAEHNDQNELYQVGQDNIRVDTQRRKTQHQGRSQEKIKGRAHIFMI